MKRREFLRTACLASACLLPACKSTVKYAESTLQGNKVVVDKKLFLEKPTITVSHNQQAIAITKLNNHNFVASILSCTHRGCAVSVQENNFICPCHGARFNNRGQVIKGPAKQDLARYITSTDHQFVYIHILE